MYAAICEGDLERVERELSAGVSPLGAQARGSILRTAHEHAARHADGAAIFVAIQRAARDAIERSATRRHGLTTRPLGSGEAAGARRGVRALRASVQRTQRLDILLVEHDLKAAARALVSLLHAPRREADVGARPVADAARLAFLYRLRGVAWTIIPFVFEGASPWHLERVPELSAVGEGIAPLARALAGAVGRRVIHLEYDRYTTYSERGGIEARAFEVDELWAPSDGPLPSPAEAEALLPGYDGPQDAFLEAAAHRRELLRCVDETMQALGVFVPPMSVHTDGYGVQLELVGVDAADVERVDVVVLQELGRPAVDRASKEPNRAPALIVGGQPPLVHAPPPLVAGPGASEPPLVVASSVAPPSEPPPLVSEPPLVSPGAPPSEAPPLVSAPPARDEPEPEDGAS